jgi:hypothetical protein
MKKIFFITYALLILCIPLYAQENGYDPLDELYIPQAEFILKLDTGIRDICLALIQEWHAHGVVYMCSDLDQLVQVTSDELDIETALRALDYCVHTDLSSQSKKEEMLRESLKQIYQEINDAYNDITQSKTRRIKIKFYNKVTTGELIVNKTAYVQDLTVQKNLIIKAASGAIISQNGLITTGQIPANAIPDSAITNSKLSSTPPAINTTNIAPMSVTPDLLAFNTVQTFANEPKPLRTYRGSVTGGGVVTSGSGFIVTQTATGNYTIDITGPAYTSSASYQAFIQLLSETDAVTLAFVSGSQFTVNTVTDHDFMFFTIGN